MGKELKEFFNSNSKGTVIRPGCFNFNRNNAPTLYEKKVDLKSFTVTHKI